MATREEAVRLAKKLIAANETDYVLPDALKFAHVIVALDERVRVLEGDNEYIRTEAAKVIDDNDRIRAHNEKLRQLMLAVQRFDGAVARLWVCRHCMASGSLTEEDGDGAAAMHDRTCAKNPLVQERNALAREVEAKQTAIDALKLALDGLSRRYETLATGEGEEG